GAFFGSHNASKRCSNCRDMRYKLARSLRSQDETRLDWQSPLLALLAPRAHVFLTVERRLSRPLHQVVLDQRRKAPAPAIASLVLDLAALEREPLCVLRNSPQSQRRPQHRASSQLQDGYPLGR